MHYWESPLLKRMAAMQRDLNRFLTKLEEMPPQESVLWVLSGRMAHCIALAGWHVDRRHHCKDGIYWYHIARYKERVEASLMSLPLKKEPGILTCYVW